MVLNHKIEKKNFWCNNAFSTAIMLFPKILIIYMIYIYGTKP